MNLLKLFENFQLTPDESADFSKIEIGLDRQGVCSGCRRIDILLKHYQSGRLRLADVTAGRLRFHASFAELQRCARSCATCRLFRQALLLSCPATHVAAGLVADAGESAVYARLVGPGPETTNGKPDGAATLLSIEIKDRPEARGVVQCIDGGGARAGLNLAHGAPDGAVAAELKRWLQICDTNHVGSCSNLRWSSRSPRRLVRIVSDLELRLACDLDRTVRYAALSYTWGTQGLDDAERELVAAGSTTRANLAERTRAFSPAELPATLQDAVRLVALVGLEYVWIDSVCIVQDEADAADFRREAPKMDEYYGNAYFTLSVCSTTKVTEPFLAPRPAFAYRINPCRLNGQWLSIYDAPREEMVAQSPLGGRAWTLQEERLSPRIVYWTAQRAYWSCCQIQMVEGSRPTVSESAADTDEASPESGDHLSDSPQAFLWSCYHNLHADVHHQWQNIVESYTRRDMTKDDDRFPALAGLASRYLDASSSDDRYIAGLWQKTFHEDLAWSVVKGSPSERRQDSDLPPTWSWASLPTRTSARLGFDFVSTNLVLKLEEVVPPAGSDQSSDAQLENPISRGAAVKQLRVSGPLQAFWVAAAAHRPWAALSRTLNGREVFSFAEPEQPVFSADPASGRVLSYRSRKREILGQLDYLGDVQRLARGELRIHALQISEKAILLLEEVAADATDTFRRVGVLHEPSWNFLDGVPPRTVTLV